MNKGLFSLNDFNNVLRWAFYSTAESFVDLYRSIGLFEGNSGRYYAINKWEEYRKRGFEHWFCNLDHDTQMKIICQITGKSMEDAE